MESVLKNAGNFLFILLSMAIGSYIMGRWMDRRHRKGEQKALAMFPALKELKPTQVITLHMKDGRTITHEAFVRVFGSKIILGTDKRFDDKLGQDAYHKMLTVRVKDVKSICVDKSF